MRQSIFTAMAGIGLAIMTLLLFSILIVGGVGVFGLHLCGDEMAMAAQLFRGDVVTTMQLFLKGARS